MPVTAKASRARSTCAMAASRCGNRSRARGQAPGSPVIGTTCILSFFTLKDRHGTGKEEARRQENHFCQASPQDCQRKEAPQVRRHPTPEGGGSGVDASGFLTTRASRSRMLLRLGAICALRSEGRATREGQRSISGRGGAGG